MAFALDFDLACLRLGADAELRANEAIQTTDPKVSIVKRKLGG